jgi:hypothetical protein
MILNDREFQLEFNLFAYGKIAEICPEKKFANIGALIDCGTAEEMKNYFRIAEILNDAYVTRIEKTKPGQTAPRLSAYLADNPEVKMWLPHAEYRELQSAVNDAITEGRTVTVESEPPKSDGKNV